jgi:hypothetical protein
VPRIAAPHVVEFRDVAIGGQTYTCWNGSVAVLGANRIFGGGSGYYWQLRSRTANLKRP